MSEKLVCARCKAYWQPGPAVSELRRDSDGRLSCVNLRECGRRVEVRRSLALATARRHVPGRGWVGRR